MVVNQTRGKVLATKARLALRARERMKGLKGLEGLKPGEALILRPCFQVHTFGMRFPIDVLFLDGQGMTVKAIHSMRPRRISPWVLEARTVLELPAGVLRETGTLVGDRILLQPVPTGNGMAFLREDDM